MSINIFKEQLKISQTKNIIESAASNDNKLTVKTHESTTPPEAPTTNVTREQRHDASFPNDFILENSDVRMQTRCSYRKKASVTLLSQFEPKLINKNHQNESWTRTIKKELDQFKRNQV